MPIKAKENTIKMENMGCFAKFIQANLAFEAGLVSVIQAIDITDQKIWPALWVETDSSLTVKALYASSLVPWKLRVYSLYFHTFLGREISVKIA